MSMSASVCDLLDSLADELEGTEMRGIGPIHEFARRGLVFAVCNGTTGTAEFRVRAEIAMAALKTPDTMASRRGPEWVLLKPAMLDQFAHDRARAWFEAGWRISGE